MSKLLKFLIPKTRFEWQTFHLTLAIIVILIAVCFSYGQIEEKEPEKPLVNDRNETLEVYNERIIADLADSDWSYYTSNVKKDAYFYNTKRISRQNNKVTLWTKTYFFNRQNAIEHQDVRDILINENVNYDLSQKTLICGSEKITTHSRQFFSDKDQQIGSTIDLNLTQSVQPDSTVAVLYDLICAKEKTK